MNFKLQVFHEERIPDPQISSQVSTKMIQNVPNRAGSKTFEVYILAAGYKRDKADSKVPGMGGRSWSAMERPIGAGRAVGLSGCRVVGGQALRFEASLKILGGWGLNG